MTDDEISILIMKKNLVIFFFFFCLITLHFYPESKYIAQIQLLICLYIYLYLLNSVPEMQQVR